MLGPGATLAATAADAGELKWLPPTGLLGLYELLLAQNLHEVEGAQPSYVTFTRVYNEKWHVCLRFKLRVNQSKCDVCERLKIFRKNAI